MAAVLRDGGQLSTSIGGRAAMEAAALSANSNLLSPSGSGLRGESSSAATRLQQQLEQSLLRHQLRGPATRPTPLVGSNGIGASLDAMRLAAAGRAPSNSEQSSLLGACMLDSYLKDTTQSLMHSQTALPPPELSLLENSINAQAQLLHRQQLLAVQEQVRRNSQLLSTANNANEAQATKRAGLESQSPKPSAKRWKPT